MLYVTLTHLYLYYFLYTLLGSLIAPSPPPEMTQGVQNSSPTPCFFPFFDFFLPLCLNILFNVVLKNMLTKNNEARVERLRLAVRSGTQAANEWVGRGGALPFPQGWVFQCCAELPIRPPFYWGCGAGSGWGQLDSAQGGAVRIVCPALQVPPPTLPPLLHTQRNPTPAPWEARSLYPSLPRTLSRPCSCPPAPSTPSSCFPSLFLKQRS